VSRWERTATVSVWFRAPGPRECASGDMFQLRPGSAFTCEIIPTIGCRCILSSTTVSLDGSTEIRSRLARSRLA